MSKALVVVSGGMDSITVLYHVVRELKFDEVEAVTFDYGSKHNDKEIPFAAFHCKFLNVQHRVIKLPFDEFKSDLLKTGGEIPEGHYEDENMSKTVVPFRNGIMLSVAAGLAESIGASKLFLGSHAGDHAIYPDCRVEFTQAMNLAVYLGTGGKIKVISPFNDITKGDIVHLGLKLGVDYSQTWSCYKGKERHCGKCGTCVERVEAFMKNLEKDPAMSDVEWMNAVEFFVKSGGRNE